MWRVSENVEDGTPIALRLDNKLLEGCFLYIWSIFIYLVWSGTRSSKVARRAGAEEAGADGPEAEGPWVR